eukprot:Gb_20877 [translate_table: standard]
MLPEFLFEIQYICNTSDISLGGFSSSAASLPLGHRIGLCVNGHGNGEDDVGEVEVWLESGFVLLSALPQISQECLGAVLSCLGFAFKTDGICIQLKGRRIQIMARWPQISDRLIFPINVTKNDDYSLCPKAAIKL